MNLEVADQPGVLSAVSGAFGANDVSIRSMEQDVIDHDGGTRSDGRARLIFITHAAREADVRATLHEVRTLDAVHAIGSVLRVVGGE